MRKVFYSLTVLAVMAVFVSCSRDDDRDLDNAIQNMELRAATLGFSDVNACTASVAEQCAAGNHENCDILNSGAHQACAYSEHVGTGHDGTHHSGTDHGTHDANGHSHNSHGSGNSENHGGSHHQTVML
jgi:hypothetical protein